MSEVLDFYEAQAKANLSTIPWLAAMQTKALREFKRFGFPTRHHEEWKYTLVDSFLKQHFAAENPVDVEGVIETDVPGAYQLMIQNGQLQIKGQLPQQISVQSLADALRKDPEKMRIYFEQTMPATHGFQALNTAILNAGLVIHIPAGVKLEQAIVLNYWQDKSAQALHNRLLIIADEGSEATIIESWRGAEDCAYFSNTITEAFLASDAHVTHYKIQREGKAAFHIGHLAVKQAHKTQFDSHSFSFGGKLVRSDSSFYLQEEHAACLLNGLYMPAEGQHIDHHTTVHHLVPSCRSAQDYKGVLTGQSRAVFNGKVVVSKGAQHTEAQQQNKNLLLSPKAEIDTKPQLEIFADDVICSHGATVGQLDEEALFYLATRGIDRQAASHYLIQAFAANNLRLVSDKPLAMWLSELINQQLR